MACFYEAGVRYTKITDKGAAKKVTDLFIVDAVSFTEAETRVIMEMQPFIYGEFGVVSLKRTNYTELIPAPDDPDADRWYKVKLNFITLDEKSMTEKRSPHYFLVEASSVENAHERTMAFMQNSMADFEIITIDETRILEVYSHEKTLFNK